MSLERRALSGTVIGVVAFVMNALQTFLLVPVLLGAWGRERYGAWLALQALVSLLAILDYGHQSYVGNELTKQYFGDRDALRLTLSSGIWTALSVGSVEVLIAISLGLLGLLPRALGLTPALVHTEHLFPALLAFAATWAVTGSIGGIVGRLFLPAGKFVRFSVWGIIARALQSLVVAAAAFSGLHLLGTALVLQGALIPYYVALFTDIRRQFPEIGPMYRLPSVSVGASHFGRSLILTGSNTILQLQQNGLNLLVTGALGAAALPAFATVRTVASTLFQVANIILAPLAPEMVRFHMKGEHAKLVATVGTTWLLGGVSIQLGMLAALPVLAPAYSVWTRHALSFDRALFALLALAVVFRALGFPLLTYLVSINRIKLLGVINSVQTVAVLAVAALGIHRFGLRAAGTGVLAGDVAGSFAIPFTFVARALPAADRSRFFGHSALAFVSLSVTALALFFYAQGVAALAVCAVGVLALSPVLLAQWRHLPLEVRTRLVGMVPRLGKATS
ncbi:MAG TPA: hypothetical protein VKU41_09385 [Polyangiaceae bacterium]|nr:hypothetical protein [Polyangiaceae bacterium]